MAVNPPGSTPPPAGTVRDAVLGFLRDAAMTTVFGNPGSTELKFFRHWPADFRYVLGLQESLVVAMADGYAQATGRPAFVNLHSAAGVGHALGSVFTAWRNQTPLVITAGQQTRALFGAEPYLFASDAASFPRPYVKSSVEPASAADVPAAIARAWQLARQKPCGPVFVSIPEDDWDREAEPVAMRAVATGFAPDPAALAELAAALAAARAPVIVAGAAVDQDGAWDAAVALAERLEAPVWASPMSGRASFPEDHRLFAGHLPPVRAQLAARLEGHDLVLVLGAPVFTYHVHTEGPVVPPGASLWLITDDADGAARALAGQALRASPGAGIAALLDALPVAARAPGQGRPAPGPAPAAHRPNGAMVMDALMRTRPEGAIVVEEVPTHRGVLRERFPIVRSGGFFAGASGGLGWALPAAVGVALGSPGVPVLCLCGDGSSLYSIQALWTAAQLHLPIVFVIFDNGGYGALKSFGAMLGIPGAPGNDIGGVDFVRLAQGFGCEAVRVDRSAELEPVLRAAWMRREGPKLVQVVLDEGVERLY
jgi:benzoylformate decarboxylase